MKKIIFLLISFLFIGSFVYAEEDKNPVIKFESPFPMYVKGHKQNPRNDSILTFNEHGGITKFNFKKIVDINDHLTIIPIFAHGHAGVNTRLFKKIINEFERYKKVEVTGFDVVFHPNYDNYISYISVQYHKQNSMVLPEKIF